MQNYLNLCLPFKEQQLYGPVNYRGFRETGPRPSDKEDGPGHPDLELSGGGLQKCFWTLWALFWAKKWGRASRTPLLDPPLHGPITGGGGGGLISAVHGNLHQNVTEIVRFFLTFGRNKRQIVDVVPTNTIVLSISILMGGYVSTNVTTRARHAKINTLYTAKPVFLESFGCEQWTFLVSQDKNTPNVNTIPFKQQINITQVIRELQVQLLIISCSITSSSSSRF